MVVEYELVDLTLFQVNTAWTKQALKLLINIWKMLVGMKTNKLD